MFWEKCGGLGNIIRAFSLMCHAWYPSFGSSTTPISFTLNYVRASRKINGLPSDLYWTQPFLIKFLPGKYVCSVSSNCYVYPTFLLHLGLILMGTTSTSCGLYIWPTSQATVLKYTGRSRSLCTPDDYSTKNKQKCFKQFQYLTTMT
jgi:hypothetical protein